MFPYSSSPWRVLLCIQTGKPNGRHYLDPAPCAAPGGRGAAAPAHRRRPPRAGRQAQRARAERAAAGVAHAAARGHQDAGRRRAWSTCCPIAAPWSCSCRSRTWPTPSRSSPGSKDSRANWPRSASAWPSSPRSARLHYEMLAAFTRRDLATYYRLNALIHAHINAAAAQPRADADLAQPQCAAAGVALPLQLRRSEVAARDAGARPHDRIAGRPRCRGPARTDDGALAAQARRGARTAAHRAARRRARGPAHERAAAAGRDGRLRRAGTPPARARPRARCCSMPPRAAATPPTRRSTRSCRWACSCRRRRDDVATALAIARDLRVPLLPRGGGTSQCGQTTGAALVIDTSKHLRNVLGFDKDAMTVDVEPGIVLDHLNAQLKPHGLWFPVDVSTSAQATLGGMAGNNSCGSRSIAYGNMVHNVAGIDALAGRRPAAVVRAGRGAGPRANARSPTSCAGWPNGSSGEIEARWPKVMRRVGRLQPRHLPAAERAALHRRRQRQPGAPAGRRRGHAGIHAQPDAAARPAAARQGAGRRQLPDASTPRWTRRSTSSSSARARSSWSTAR